MGEHYVTFVKRVFFLLSFLLTLMWAGALFSSFHHYSRCFLNFRHSCTRFSISAIINTIYITHPAHFYNYLTAKSLNECILKGNYTSLPQMQILYHLPQAEITIKKRETILLNSTPMKIMSLRFALQVKNQNYLRIDDSGITRT